MPGFFRKIFCKSMETEKLIKLKGLVIDFELAYRSFESSLIQSFEKLNDYKIQNWIEE